MITLAEARYVDGYRIAIKFSDGASGIVDFADIIHKFPAAAPLLDLNEFQRFFLDDWPTLAWPCGFDFSPEALYEHATGRTVPWLHEEKQPEVDVTRAIANGQRTANLQGATSARGRSV